MFFQQQNTIRLSSIVQSQQLPLNIIGDQMQVYFSQLLNSQGSSVPWMEFLQDVPLLIQQIFSNTQQ